jgi:hypothetical protein
MATGIFGLRQDFSVATADLERVCDLLHTLGSDPGILNGRWAESSFQVIVIEWIGRGRAPIAGPCTERTGEVPANGSHLECLAANGRVAIDEGSRFGELRGGPGNLNGRVSGISA